MARFDVHARRDGGPGYLLDCQAELLASLNTRFVVPLLPIASAPPPARQLDPLFEIAGETHVMVTQFAAVVPATVLGMAVASLADHGDRIIAAINLLLTGV